MPLKAGLDDKFAYKSFVDNPFFDFDEGPNFDETWDSDYDWGDSGLDQVDSVLSSLPKIVEGAQTSQNDKDIDPEGPCKGDLIGHPECNYGDSRGVCLWTSAADSVRWANRFGSPDFFRPVSTECKAYLIEFLTDASSHPFEYFRDLRSQCDDALKALCRSENKEQTALACLRSNFDQIQQQACRDEITQLNSWTSLEASWWSPMLWRKCSDERSGVCSNSTSSGLGDFRECLDAKRENLSENCRRALFESDLQAAPSPFLLRKDVAGRCRADAKNYCSDVVRGDENQLFCLYRASKRSSDSKSSFSPECKQAVESVVKLLESDYRMNVPIRKFCRRTINQFCAEEKDENDKQVYESDKVMGCLKRVLLHEKHLEATSAISEWHEYEETEACMHAVRQSVLIDSLDWEVNSNLHSNCYQEYHKLLLRIKQNDASLRDPDSCKGETPHECLQSHFHDIGNAECQRAVALQAQLSSLDQDFKPHLLSACALSIDQLKCGESGTENDDIVDCLYENAMSVSDNQCRAAIRHDYELSERDFRLSYELSLGCAKDRKTLCDSTPPEQVLKCMIDNTEKITDLSCAKEVKRLAFVALNEGEDVVEKSSCAADVVKFCSNNAGGHGLVQSCLLSNLGELSEACASAVLNLHTNSASHAAMGTLLNSACSQTLISEECAHLVSGGSASSIQDRVDCIEKVKKAATKGAMIARECQVQLSAVKSLLAADYRTNPDMQRDCKTDVLTLCAEKGEEIGPHHHLSTNLIQCLVTKRADIRNSNCKKQIIRQVYRMSENVMYVANMRQVCGDDIKKFCSHVTPGDGKIHGCLREHIEELSHDCQSQEFTVEQIEGLTAETRSACSYELSSFCKESNIMNGGELHCLWRNVDDAALACQSAVKKDLKGKIGNIWLDPNLYTKCRVNVNQLVKESADKCPSHLIPLPVPLNGLIPLPSNYTQAVAGEHVACLASNRGKIDNRGCLNAVEDLLRMEMQDPVLMRFGLRNSCGNELKASGVCGASDPFETVEQWKCLQEQVRAETSKAVSYTCRDAVKRMWRLSLIDVKFNPDVTSNCASDIKEHCKQFSGSKVLACLYEKSKIPEVLTSECTEAVGRMPPPASVDYESPWKAAQKSVEQKEEEPELLPVIEQPRLLRETENSLASDISLSGPLAFVSLASLVVVVLAALYRLYRYKMKKGYMVIVEKA